MSKHVVVWNPPINKPAVCRIFDSEAEAATFAGEQLKDGWPKNVQVARVVDDVDHSKRGLPDVFMVDGKPVNVSSGESGLAGVRAKIAEARAYADMASPGQGTDE